MLEDVLELRTTMWPSRYRGNSTCEEWWTLCVSSRRRDRLGHDGSGIISANSWDCFALDRCSEAFKGDISSVQVQEFECLMKEFKDVR